MRVTTFCRKAFTRRSSLRSELRTLGTPVVDDATVDVLGMCVYAFPFVKAWYILVVYLYAISQGYYIHIGVGFGVAYLYREASSKARNVR